MNLLEEIFIEKEAVDAVMQWKFIWKGYWNKQLVENGWWEGISNIWAGLCWALGPVDI
jgi:hypothetical protein